MEKKILTRVRLINWHYFENETISLNGSTLVSGENTAGKSTILDAIQLVMTTNTRKFNVAANEKGKRDLKGYVRCKIGNVGEPYLRKNAVISNVALEFYEEKTKKYFVIGLHMTSSDEESSVATKWYTEEVRLEELTFLTGNKPSLQKEFKVKGRPVKYIDQKSVAKERFKRRMGNLEDRFFDIIPKSLAFKPMDNVKDFINKFILSDDKIDVESLRINIETLKELEVSMNRANNKLEMLIGIVDKYEEVCEKEKDILVNEFLIKKAKIEYCEEIISNIKSEMIQIEQMIEDSEKQGKELERYLNENRKILLNLQLSAKTNECYKLVEDLKSKIGGLEVKIEESKNNIQKLMIDGKNIAVLLKLLQKKSIQVIDKSELEEFLSPIEPQIKAVLYEKISTGITKQLDIIRTEDFKLQLAVEELDYKIKQTQEKLSNLEKRKLQFPQNTINLKQAIEAEYIKRGIQSKVYIVAELLEITDEHWKNAVEGYFNNQKFNLIVEPEYYNVALGVYHKNQGMIHTAGIINTRKLEMEKEANNLSLAYVIHSENRYAKAYANYVLGRVMRCEKIEELENHRIAITNDCMLYQGFVVRNIDKQIYKDPFIGQKAYLKHLENAKKEYIELSEERRVTRNNKQELADILSCGKKFNPQLTASYMNEPYYLMKQEAEKREANKELEEANSNPTLIELTIQIGEKDKAIKDLEVSRSKVENEKGRLQSQKEEAVRELSTKQREHKELEFVYIAKVDSNNTCKLIADEKYIFNRKTKSPKMIKDNFAPQKSQFEKELDELENGNDGLKARQEKFNSKHEQDFQRGIAGMSDYNQAKMNLEAIELVRFEEDLKKAKEVCEEIFKKDFLSKMRNNIENARNEFKHLNKALKDIYYGDDSYRFIITYDKQKESLYRMITSENNHEGYSLWTQEFEAEYKEEMEDLFSKLMTKDDKGDKVILEYTDYRSYLDYDIEIHKKNGVVQKFSAIYGEKSGSETQVPYYVAIAASFYQLYRLGNSVRIMLLDEAFDKMDDERITSMVDFFNSLELQVIMATPPAKIEIIGERVSTILTAIRVGSNSIVEEYDM